MRKSGKVEVWKSMNSKISLLVKDKRKARKINKKFEIYPRDTKFKDGEEALFILDQDKAQEALNLIGMGELLKGDLSE